MLHAVFHNKGSIWRRYIGHRDGSDGNVYAEDEITSVFLGTQQFLDTAQIWKIWHSVIGNDIAPLNESQPPASCKIDLWPRRGIEPDAFITFHWPNNIKRHLLIEFKWDAGESGDNQLKRQWEDFLTSEERLNTFHLFIAKDTSPGLMRLKECPILPLTWLQIRSALKSVAHDDKLALYCNLMDKFFEKIQIYPFTGFSNLPESPILPQYSYALFNAAITKGTKA